MVLVIRMPVTGPQAEFFFNYGEKKMDFFGEIMTRAGPKIKMAAGRGLISKHKYCW